jgi:hypothetical protein
LQDVGILQIFYSLTVTVIQRAIVDSPAFLEHGSADHGLCPYNPCAELEGGLEAFLYEAAHNFEVFSNIQNYNLNIKNL